MRRRKKRIISVMNSIGSLMTEQCELRQQETFSFLALSLFAPIDLSPFSGAHHPTTIYLSVSRISHFLSMSLPLASTSSPSLSPLSCFLRLTVLWGNRASVAIVVKELKQCSSANMPVSEWGPHEEQVVCICTQPHIHEKMRKEQNTRQTDDKKKEEEGRIRLRDRAEITQGKNQEEREQEKGMNGESSVNSSPLNNGCHGEVRCGAREKSGGMKVVLIFPAHCEFFLRLIESGVMSRSALPHHVCSILDCTTDIHERDPRGECEGTHSPDCYIYLKTEERKGKIERQLSTGAADPCCNRNYTQAFC